MKKLLYLFLAITVACSSGDDSSDNNDPQNNDPQNNDPNNNVPSNCDVVYLDANGVTIKACPDAQVGESGEVNGVTYTIVDEDELRYRISSNGDWTNICTTYVTSMEGLFMGNDNINSNFVAKWDVSNVTNMERMFFHEFTGGEFFNQNITYWDVSSVTNMSHMFYQQRQFNQPIREWDVSSVTNMEYMFGGCFAFNRGIGNWNTSNVTDMSGMFWYTYNFNQDLSNWNIFNVTECEGFADNTPNWILPKPNFVGCIP